MFRNVAVLDSVGTDMLSVISLAAIWSLIFEVIFRLPPRACNGGKQKPMWPHLPALLLRLLVPNVCEEAKQPAKREIFILHSSVNSSQH